MKRNPIYMQCVGMSESSNRYTGKNGFTAMFRPPGGGYPFALECGDPQTYVVGNVYVFDVKDHVGSGGAG